MIEERAPPQKTMTRKKRMELFGTTVARLKEEEHHHMNTKTTSGGRPNSFKQ
jgi:hypothetical protein